MGLFGFGSKGGSKVDRWRKKLTNAWVQPMERERAMAALADIGTEEALSALLQRFTFRTEGGITDEDEKRTAYELLLAAGDKAILPIEGFVAASDGVYWPLRALKEIAGIEAAVEALLRALDRAEKIPGRVNEQKTQLVSNMRDFPHPKVLARLKRLAAEPSIDVRIMALDGLLTYGEPEAKPIVAERLLDPEESPRVLSVLFEQLVDLEWSLEPWREALEEKGVLPDHYRFGPGGKLKRVV